MQELEAKSKGNWPTALLAIIIILLIFSAIVRSWLDSSYTQNRILIYPLLLLCFQYGLAIYEALGVLIVAVLILKFRRIGCAVPSLLVLVFIGIGIVEIMFTYPDLQHMASIRFNDRTYHIVTDARYEEDSTSVPTAYLVYKCDYQGINCHRTQLLFRDESVYADGIYSHPIRKVEFVINSDEDVLYAKIDDQIFSVITGDTKEEF
jgi:hypothetical protein